MSEDVSGTDDLRRSDPAGVPARHSPPRRAVIYTQTAGPTSAVSWAHHAAQEDQGQEADRLALEVVAVLSDIGAPGSLQARSEGWLQVEATIRSGEVGVVLTSHLDRVTRSWADLAMLYSLRVEFSVEFRTPSRDLTDDVTIAVRHVARKAPPAERRRPGRGGAPGHPVPTEDDH